MGILGNIFNKRPSASPDSVSFDVSRYSYQGEQNGTRVWYLPEGGGIGLYFFPQPTPIPNNLTTLEQLREFYTSQWASKLILLDCRVKEVDGVRSVLLIGKALNQESPGATYIGSITIPFRDFSFVIKAQCQEQGITGVRETALVADAMNNGTMTIEDGRPIFHGWSPDDEQFDEKFPWHPLSRVRAELRSVLASTKIDPTIKGESRIELPPDSP